jgi:hypothetical protein
MHAVSRRRESVGGVSPNLAAVALVDSGNGLQADDLKAEVGLACELTHGGMASKRSQLDVSVPRRGLRPGRQTSVMFDPSRIPNDHIGCRADLIVGATPDDPTPNRFSAQSSDLTRAGHPTVRQSPDDVLVQLKSAKPGLKLGVQSVTSPNPLREAERLQTTQSASGQGRPGVGSPHSIVDEPITFGRCKESSIQPREAIGLGLAPDSTLRLHAREITQKLLRHLLGPRPKSVGDVVAWDDKVPSALATPADHNMSMGLIGIEMTDREPLQARLTQILAHASHDLARVALQVRDPIAVLRRDDEAEVMSIVSPRPRHGRSG